MKVSRGTLITIVILGGVGVFLLLNREPSKPLPDGKSAAKSDVPETGTAPVARLQEHPIGEEVTKNSVQVAAVWLASIGMDGRPIGEGRSLIHVEADIRSTANNPNGFAKDEFIPYLKIRYKLLPAGSTKPLQMGEMIPMIASDGLHYGANIEKPAPGSYQMVYEIEPPSAGGLGRHSDPASGVAPWWEPFTATFEWVLDGTD